MTEFERKLSNAIEDAIEHNDSFASGVSVLLVGRTVTSASAEVWSSDGDWSIRLTFDDGSTVYVPGTTEATGPLADFVRMAGGNPTDEFGVAG